jgi:MFS superfamily sulfate permease-like transporter
MNEISKPKDGLEALKRYWQKDALSGFLVFILALPLSMGIAQASEFPPIYGLITAMVGGLFVSLLAGSPLTIKGPAAGLIVIVAGCVSDFGGGDTGWKLALGAIVVAGIIQVIFGLMKFGKLVDFFPLAAVHGMLAAIGIIIMSKQFHGVLGLSPVHGWLNPALQAPEAGKSLVEPFELFEAIPYSLSHFDPTALKLGLVCLLIVFGWPMIKNKITKRIPAPLIVLLVAIPLARFWGLNEKLFVGFSKGLTDIIAVNVSFDGFQQIGTFIKYVIMFALVGSLEALLTVKAIDMIDPFRRKSNANKDLVAVGLGNTLSGIFGGLPMISEVARSSANVGNGAVSRWSNFYHGFFMLIFLLFAVSFSGMIPKPALAAMLIGVGFKLAHPKEFMHMWHIGKEQLVIFIGTILATLATDLLVGIFVGILIKIIIELMSGVKANELFKAKHSVAEKGNEVHIDIQSSLIFSNFLSLNKTLQALPSGKQVRMDVSKATVIDHSTIENIHHFQEDYRHKQGDFHIEGLDHFTQASKHKYALRINKSRKKS